MLLLLALIQGAAVGFLPSADTVFTNDWLHGFSEKMFKDLFFPLLAAAFLSSLMASFFKQVGKVFFMGIGANIVGLAFIGGSEIALQLGSGTYWWVWIGATFLGIGLGWTLVGASVFLSHLFVPKKGALLAFFYTLFGTGFLASFLLVDYGLLIQYWWIGTLLLAAFFSIVCFFWHQSDVVAPPREGPFQSLPLFGALLYGFCAAAVFSGHLPYLVEIKGLIDLQADKTLTAFFATLEGVRLVLGFVFLWGLLRFFHLILPLIAALAFLALTALIGVAENTLGFMFIAVGLSAIFPLNLAFCNGSIKQIGVQFAGFFFGLGMATIVINWIGVGAIFYMAAGAAFGLFITNALSLYFGRHPTQNLRKM